MSSQSQIQVKAAVQPSRTLAPSGLLQRQCACGGTPGLDGECEACRKKRWIPLQSKLRMSTAGDRYEEEANRLAEQTMRMADPAVAGHVPSCLQRMAVEGTEATAAPAIVDDVLSSAGQPLNAAARIFFESRFGHDFSRVRVHSDAQAAESARAVDARAYTVGQHIVFGPGEYAPSAEAGRRLLAHELTHVIQQSGPPMQQSAPPSSPWRTALPLQVQSAPRSIQRFMFDENCAAHLVRKVTDGHRLAEQATKRARELLQNKPTGMFDTSFNYLFGPGGEANRAKIAANFDVLHNSLKEDYTYTCPPQGEKPCIGAQAEVLDKDTVAVCGDKIGGFSRTGMARLLVHESVRRAQGRRNVTNINNAIGECVYSLSQNVYAEATTDANHPIPYSCFAEKVLEAHLEEQQQKVNTLLQKLWPSGLPTTYWNGTIEMENAQLAVNVALTVKLMDIDLVVMGSYSYSHPQRGQVEGEIPFGVLKITEAPGEAKRLSISFDWREGSASGRGYWQAEGTDQLKGRWGRGDSTTNGGNWSIKSTR